MWSIRQLAVRSNERAVANARCAATELSRALVERHEVELHLAALVGQERPSAVVERVTATR